MSKNDLDGEVKVSKMCSQDKRIKISYDNENEFNKLSKSLKVYNMGAYKEFVFYYVPRLRNGEIIGITEDNIHYKQKLSSDNISEYVHGELFFTYRIEDNERILESIEPSDFLSMAHSSLLEIYKGIPVTCAKDKFKVDLYLAKKE